MGIPAAISIDLLKYVTRVEIAAASAAGMMLRLPYFKSEGDEKYNYAYDELAWKPSLFSRRPNKHRMRF